MFIDKITSIFDQTCDPVNLDNQDLSCLLWADDLVLLSTSQGGLQNAIDKTHRFYNNLGLQMNTKKTKVMIFNSRGLKLTNEKIFLDGSPLEIVDSYQYLGIKFKPSGSMVLASSELIAKASRAWFSISNIIYKNKRMEFKHVIKLFDSLVTPVFNYGCAM